MKCFSRLCWIFILFLGACNGEQYHIQPINENGLNKLIEERHGKILLLNVWATWCNPCRKEFPELVKLQHDYQNSNVEIVAISVDYLDEINSKIIPFIKDKKVNFKVFVQDFEQQGGFINTLNEEWNGGLPVTVIFDEKGEQKIFISGAHDYAYFKQQLEKIKQAL